MKRFIFISLSILSTVAFAGKEGEGHSKKTSPLLQKGKVFCLFADPKEAKSHEQREKSILSAVFSAARRVTKGFDLKKNPGQCANNPDYFSILTKASLDSKVKILKNYALTPCVKAFKESLETKPLDARFSEFNEKTGGKGIGFLTALVKFVEKPQPTARFWNVEGILNQSIEFDSKVGRYELIKGTDGTPVLYEKIKEKFF